MIRNAALLAAAVWAASAGVALAEHFGPLWQIKIGAKLVLYQPEILLLLSVSGLVMSYWNRRNVIIGFAAFFLGVLIGFPLVFVWQIDMVWLALVMILVLGGCVALQLFLPVRMVQAYLLLAGACSAPLALFGHHYSETPPYLLGNFVFTQFLILSAAFAVCALLRRQAARHWWMAIVLRVFGSWASAAAVMMAAFYLAGPPAA